MRIAICDYSGHPFQVQLSRELASRGHETCHLHFAEFQTPKGRLQVEPDDPPGLMIDAVSLGQPFAKHSFLKRLIQERRVGRLMADRIARHRPDVIVACNLPIDPLDIVVRDARKSGTPVVFWQQDIYSHAIRATLERKFGLPGSWIGAYYGWLERRAARRSATVVAISEHFRPTLEHEFGLSPDRVHVVENWAPLEEIDRRRKDNPWSRAHGLWDRKVVLYTGTLGHKHDPAQILRLAERLQPGRAAEIVVVSEGPSATWLADEARARNLANLKVLPFQDFAVYPNVLGSADVLISVLEPEAGGFSVPSKVLSYLCSGRAIVLSAPLDNLAASIVTESGAGRTVSPGDQDGFCAAVESFLSDPAACAEAGQRARSYAEKTFEIARIGDRFEAIITGVVRQAASARHPAAILPETAGSAPR